MKYVESNLMPNEEVLLSAKIHWIVYLKSVVLILLGILFYGVPVILSIFVLLGLISFVLTLISVKSTELVITSKRVIAKFGLIKRQTMELDHSKIESLMVNQGIIGRIVNAGTIIINGTGGNATPIPSISDPLGFRKEYYKIVENSR